MPRLSKPCIPQAFASARSSCSVPYARSRGRTGVTCSGVQRGDLSLPLRAASFSSFGIYNACKRLGRTGSSLEVNSSEAGFGRKPCETGCRPNRLQTLFPFLWDCLSTCRKSLSIGDRLPELAVKQVSEGLSSGPKKSCERIVPVLICATKAPAVLVRVNGKSGCPSLDFMPYLSD